MDSAIPKTSSVEQVYKNRSQFVVVGLTGRTGSGCTSSANILEETFKNIKPPERTLQKRR